MIKVGIIGATGYAGGELVRLLSQREDVEIIWYGSKSYVNEKYSKIYKNTLDIVGDICKDDNMELLAEQADIIFTATPQGYCAGLMNENILSKTKVIDLSADYRIKDVKVYEEWYKLTHNSPKFIEEAVYGLPELYSESIKKARLIANPGCYPTCSTLLLYPLVKEGVIDTNTIIIDAKSGTSGAGRSAKVDNLYCEVNENIKAYAVNSHRHTPEIEQQLSSVSSSPIKLSFTPHLVPMNRGILITAYANLVEGVNDMQIAEIYNKYYADKHFIRMLKGEDTPNTKWVEGSNFVDLNFSIDKRTNRIVLLGALDNLVKGAAGQAMQNMNLMFNLPEDKGLKIVPIFP